MTDTLRDVSLAATVILAIWAAWRSYRKDTSETVRADFDSLRDELRKQLEDARQEAAEDRETAEKERKRRAEIERRLSEVERGLGIEREQRELAVIYIGHLVDALESVGAHIPDPPEGLEISWTRT